MRICKQVRYAMPQLNLVLEQFTNNVPKKPYCSDDLYLGLQIRPKATALLKRYIQHNHPYYTHYFVFDLDSKNNSEPYSAYVDYLYSMVGVPEPNLVVENPENGHAHFIYQLATPIYNTDASKPKPIKYANAVYLALRTALDADINYSGLITKNALHSSWRTHVLREQPYTLDQLSERLDLTTKQINKEIKIDEAVGLGRNCCVFHTVRHWAYVEIRRYRGKTYDQWLDAVTAHCCSINVQFNDPMQYNEVKGIAKSIARWVWKKDGYFHHEFIDRQTRKGALGGKAKGEAYNDKRKQAVRLKGKGLSNTDIAKKLGVARYTVIRWLNEVSQ